MVPPCAAGDSFPWQPRVDHNYVSLSKRRRLRDRRMAVRKAWQHTLSFKSMLETELTSGSDTLTDVSQSIKIASSSTKSCRHIPQPPNPPEGCDVDYMSAFLVLGEKDLDVSHLGTRTGSRRLLRDTQGADQLQTAQPTPASQLCTISVTCEVPSRRSLNVANTADSLPLTSTPSAILCKVVNDKAATRHQSGSSSSVRTRATPSAFVMPERGARIWGSPCPLCGGTIDILANHKDRKCPTCRGLCERPKAAGCSECKTFWCIMCAYVGPCIASRSSGDMVGD